MGWMEVLALLKRIAPLLGRLAPMLETFLATRTGGRADTDALERLSGDIKGQLASAGEQHTGLADAVRSQAALLSELTRQMDLQHQRGKAAETQLDGLARSLADLRRTVLLLGTGLAVLMFGCLGLLLRLVFHRPA